MIKCLLLFHLQDEADVGAIDWKALIPYVLQLLFEFTLNILESEDFGVFYWEILIWIPITVFQGFDASVFLEALSGLFKWRIDLIREVHVLSVSTFEVSVALMLLRDLVDVLLELVLFLLIFIVFLFTVILHRGIAFVVFVFSADDGDLHLVKQALELVGTRSEIFGSKSQVYL